MKKQASALGKATSSILAFVLAVGLVPSGAMAYAAEAAAQLPAASQADESAAQSASSEASQSEIASENAPTSAGESAATSEGAGVDVAAEGEAAMNGEGEAAPAEGTDADSQGQSPATTYTVNANGVINAQVPLGTSAQAPTVGDIQVGGLTYTINPDDPTTVSVTGVAATKPEGDVAVQAQIANGGTTYKVTNISTYLQMGGGVRRF